MLCDCVSNFLLHLSENTHKHAEGIQYTGLTKSQTHTVSCEHPLLTPCICFFHFKQKSSFFATYQNPLE